MEPEPAEVFLKKLAVIPQILFIKKVVRHVLTVAQLSVDKKIKKGNNKNELD